MPLYEYQCVNCKASFERIQKFSDPPLRKCEKCGGKLERLISSPAIQFKGTGWYVTDYARKPASAHGKDSGASEASKAADGHGAEAAKSSKPSKPAEATAK